MSIIPGLRSLRQEDCLDYTVGPYLKRRERRRRRKGRKGKKRKKKKEEEVDQPSELFRVLLPGLAW